MLLIRCIGSLTQVIHKLIFFCKKIVCNMQAPKIFDMHDDLQNNVGRWNSLLSDAHIAGRAPICHSSVTVGAMWCLLRYIKGGGKK